MADINKISKELLEDEEIKYSINGKHACSDPPFETAPAEGNLQGHDMVITNKRVFISLKNSSGQVISENVYDLRHIKNVNEHNGLSKLGICGGIAIEADDGKSFNIDVEERNMRDEIYDYLVQVVY